MGMLKMIAVPFVFIAICCTIISVLVFAMNPSYFFEMWSDEASLRVRLAALPFLGSFGLWVAGGGLWIADWWDDRKTFTPLHNGV